MSTWVLAIDFGTSVTAAATVDLEGHRTGLPRPVEVGGSWRVPSSVFRTADGSLVVGGLAERQAALDPSSYEPTPKRRMADTSIGLGGATVEVADAVAALLATVAGEACRTHGGVAPVATCLTHPAEWASSRRAALCDAARRAGLGEVVLLPEPVAAAAWYASTTPVRPGARIAVFDLGGGTFDAAVVESGPDGTWTTVGRPGGIDPLGGVDVDHLLLEVVGASIAARQPDVWARLDQPGLTSSRRQRRALLQEVQQVKEDLSTVSSASLLVPETTMEVSVTRSELVEAIDPLVERAAQVMADTVAAAGSSPQDLDAVYLVGGSSRIPLVADVVRRRLGVEPSTLDEPKQVVAMGAALHVAAHAVAPSAAPPPSGVAAPAPPAPAGPLPPPPADRLPPPPSAPPPPVATRPAPPPPVATASAPPPIATASAPPPLPPDGIDAGGSAPARRGWLVGAGLLALVIVVAVSIAIGASGGGSAGSSGTTGTSSTNTTDTSTTNTSTTTEGPLTSTSTGNAAIDAHLQPWTNPAADCELEDPDVLATQGASDGVICAASSDGNSFVYRWWAFATTTDYDQYFDGVSAGSATIAISDRWVDPDTELERGPYVNGLVDTDGFSTWGFDDDLVVCLLYYGTTAAEANAFWSDEPNAYGTN